MKSIQTIIRQFFHKRLRAHLRRAPPDFFPGLRKPQFFTKADNCEAAASERMDAPDASLSDLARAIKRDNPKEIVACATKILSSGRDDVEVLEAKIVALISDEKVRRSISLAPLSPSL